MCWTNVGGGRNWSIFPCCFDLQYCLSWKLYFIIFKPQLGVYFNIFPNFQARRLGKFCSHKIFFFSTSQIPDSGVSQALLLNDPNLISNLCVHLFFICCLLYTIFLCIYAYIDRYSYTVHRFTYRCRVINMYSTSSAFLKNPF